MLDYLIVGQGLAGTFFSAHVDACKKSYLVINDEREGASHAAAGLYNPVVLKRFRKVWKAEEALEQWSQLLSFIEEQTDKTFRMDLQMIRRFSSIEEQNTWIEKSDNPGFSKFLGKVVSDDSLALDMPFGYGEVGSAAGRIDLPLLLSSWKRNLMDNGSYQKDHFDYEQLVIDRDTVRYKKWTARHIVFCEGIKTLKNPLFRDLPLVANKGEYIRVRTNLNLKQIVNAGHFIVPESNGECTIGATYNPGTNNEDPSDKAAVELLEFWERITGESSTKVAHVVGVRPTVKDRRPLLGTHPKHDQVHLLNGFGSRGILMGPLLCKLLFEAIEKSVPLPEECDIKRFYL